MDQYEQLGAKKREIEEALAKLEPLQAEYEDLKGKVLEDLLARGVKSEDKKDAKFTVRENKSWNYPRSITEVEREVEEEKKVYQKQHPGDYSVNPTLTVTLRDELEKPKPQKGRIH